MFVFQPPTHTRTVVRSRVSTAHSASLYHLVAEGVSSSRALLRHPELGQAKTPDGLRWPSIRTLATTLVSTRRAIGCRILQRGLSGARTSGMLPEREECTEERADPDM